MGADGAFKKAAKAHRRTHKERAQPEERAKRGAGLLEKHKDYVVRARNYNEKQRRLKALMEKARFRNPDEFYFKMVNSRTKARRPREPAAGAPKRLLTPSPAVRCLAARRIRMACTRAGRARGPRRSTWTP